MNELLKDEIINIIKNIPINYFNRRERDFAYELYAQLRSNLKLPKNIEVTSETYKTIYFDDNQFYLPLIGNIMNQQINKKRYPDLVIHQYDSINPNNQLFAFEIKMRINIPDIIKDLKKLVMYCLGNLQYQKGILILSRNNNIDRIKMNENIRNILKEIKQIEIWNINSNKEISIINYQNVNN